MRHVIAVLNVPPIQSLGHPNPDLKVLEDNVVLTMNRARNIKCFGNVRCESMIIMTDSLELNTQLNGFFIWRGFRIYLRMLLFLGLKASLSFKYKKFHGCCVNAWQDLGVVHFGDFGSEIWRPVG